MNLLRRTSFPNSPRFSRPRRENGYTLVEMMLVAALMGILFSMGPRLISQFSDFYLVSSAQIEVQRDAQFCMAEIDRLIPRLKSGTAVIGNAMGQPFFSRLKATDVDGVSIEIRQQGTELIVTTAGKDHSWTQYLRSLSFVFPTSTDHSTLSVSLAMEKTFGLNKKRVVFLLVENVPFMNS